MGIDKILSFLNISLNDNDKTQKTNNNKNGNEPLPLGSKNLPTVDMPEFSTQSQDINVEDEKAVWKFFEKAFQRGDNPLEKFDKNNLAEIKLTKEEQKILKKRIESYEKYRQSLSEEERAKLDNSNIRKNVSEEIRKNIDNYIKKGDFSSINKFYLAHILQTTDKTNWEQDGKIGSFTQGGVGSCWLLTALRNISTDKENAQIIKDSITNNNDGTYTVKFKGLEKFIKDDILRDKSNVITDSILKDVKKAYPDIKEEDLSMIVWELYNKAREPKDDKEKFILDKINKFDETEEGKKYNKEVEKKTKEKMEQYKDGITVSEQELNENIARNPKGKDYGSFVTGDKDVRIIEMAVHKFNLTRGMTVDAGRPSVAYKLLLNKDTEDHSLVRQASYDEMVELFKLRKEGKITETEHWERTFYNPVNDKEKARLIEILENSDPSTLTAGTKNPSDTELKEYMAGKEDDVLVTLKSDKLGTRAIYKMHIYNIKNVNKQDKTITVENPHNPDVPIELTYDEFFKYFSNFQKMVK